MNSTMSLGEKVFDWRRSLRIGLEGPLPVTMLGFTRKSYIPIQLEAQEIVE